MTRPLHLLSIGAHPADVFDQCGGTLAHHAGRGDHVACVTLTHGARVHDEVISESMAHRRELPESSEMSALMAKRSEVKVEEVRKACRILGVENVHFFGEDDAVLLVTKEIVRRLARLLREVQPDIVLTHFPREGDGLANAHAVTGQIALHAIQFAGSVDPEDRRPPHGVAQVFFFGEGAAHVRRGLWGAEGGYTNDVFIDISDVIEKKLAALDCLESQGYSGAYARKRIETSDGAFGIAARRAYAEGFISLRAETHRYLPVTEEMLADADASDHQAMDQYSFRLPV